MSYVNLYYGSLSEYNELQSKDNNKLYFCGGIIFKGTTPFSQKISQVNSLPQSGTQGVIYLLPDYSMYFYDGTDFQTISVGVVGSISDDISKNNKCITQAAAKTYINAVTSNLAVASQVASDITTAKSEAISSAGTYTDGEIADLKEELETEINQKVASVFRFKGSKDNYEAIEALTDMVTGDVWHSNADGKEYVYDGTNWELLGFTIDLSAYATTIAVTNAINAKATEIIATINAYSKSEVDALVGGVSSSLSSHTSDTTSHITSAERNAWNAKATTSQVATAKSEAISSANDYTDTKVGGLNTRLQAVEGAITWNSL